MRRRLLNSGLPLSKGCDNMTIEEMVVSVKANLRIEDDSRDLIITDVIQEVLNFCNLTEPPAGLEPFIRRKVKAIIDYEAENSNTVFDVQSIREGDVSITYNTDEVSRETIYGLSEKDKQALMRFRRLRR